jgi:NAD(P)H-dependent flavin oxidoreductase YrpB (nitropropane dioxygenase family)
MFKGVGSIQYGGREVLPLIEGGKGVSATNHMSSGAWAAAGGIGTVSAVNADSYDPEGRIVPQVYNALTRRERHEELIRTRSTAPPSRCAAPSKCRTARARSTSTCCGNGGRPAHPARRSGAHPRMVAGVTCGAGHAVQALGDHRFLRRQLLPIISSARAFRALWKRAYSKAAEWLSAVVYEDPWLAGGHNGLSNAEDPLRPKTRIPA